MASRGLQRWLLVLLVLLPALLVAWLTLRLAPDVPLVDEWSLVQDIDHFLSGSLTAAEIWRSHNGHRIPLPRLIQVLLAVASGWDVRWPMALGWAAMLVAATIAAHRLRPALVSFSPSARTAALFVGSLALFSTNQSENWLWGFMLCVLLAAATTTGALALLARDQVSWPCFFGALTLALAASLSFGSALAVWPAGALVLLLSPQGRQRIPQLVAWGAMALGLAAFYLSPATGDANATGGASLLARPLDGAYFFLTFLGAPVVSYAGSAWPPKDSGVGFAAGLVGLAVLSATVVAWWRRGRPCPPTWARFAAGWIVVSIGAAFLSTLGRVDAGGPGAFASRYGTWATPLWLVLWLILFHRAQSRVPSARPARVLRAAPAWILAASIAASWLEALPDFRGRHDALRLADDALYHGGPEPLLAYLTPDLPQIRVGRPVLLRRGLSVFHHPRRERLAEPNALDRFGQAITVATTPPEVARLPSRVEVEIANPSTTGWPYLGRDASQTGAVRLASRWRTPEGHLVAEGPRTDLPHDVAPGERLASAVCIVPPPAGSYVLEIGLVQEGVAWFSDRGATPWSRSVVVRDGVARLGRRAVGIAWSLLGGEACR